MHTALATLEWETAYSICGEGKAAGAWMAERLVEVDVKRQITELHIAHLDFEQQAARLASRLLELAREVTAVAGLLSQLNSGKAATWAALAETLRTEQGMMYDDLDGIRREAQHEFITVVCASAVQKIGRALGANGLSRLPSGRRSWNLEAVRSDDLQKALNLLRDLTQQIRQPRHHHHTGQATPPPHRPGNPTTTQARQPHHHTGRGDHYPAPLGIGMATHPPIHEDGHPTHACQPL